MSDDITEALKELRTEIGLQSEAIADMKATIEDSKTFIEKIQQEIGPLLEKLQSNSMFKMMFGSK